MNKIMKQWVTMEGLEPEFDFDFVGPYHPSHCDIEIKSTRMDTPVFLDREGDRLVVWTCEDDSMPTILRRFQIWGTDQPVDAGLTYCGTWRVGVHHLHLWEIK